MIAFLTDIALADLSFRDKGVAKSCLIDGKTQDEAGEEFGIKQETVSRIMSKAKEELKKPFSRWLFSSVLKEKSVEEFFNEQ